MPIPQTTPDQAKAALEKDKNSIYLDVRSIPEFVQGHPAGAINIPLLHYKPEAGGMFPNPDFSKVAQAVLSKEKSYYVGCKSGGRSQRACEILSQAGFSRLFNVDGGFGGNEHQKGWKELGLPVSIDNGKGIGYESLASGIK